MNIPVPEILFLQNRVAYTRDEQSYKKLFYHFHGQLFRFAFNLVKNTEVADEIVSDVMMKVWDMGSKLAQVEKLNLYLFTAVKNTAFTHLNKIKREAAELDESIENSIADSSDNPENKLLYTEVEQKIEAAIRSLPPQCQLVFRLIREQGFSHKEACAILQVSQNTLETQMRIALKKIRLALSSYLSKK